MEPVTLVGGVANSNSFASLSPGSYAIAATYGGSINFKGSSAVLNEGVGQNVTKAATSMASPLACSLGDPAVPFTGRQA